MKNIYEIKLENLIKEYDLLYMENNDSTEIHNIIMELFKTRCHGKKVALWGAGRKNTETSHAAIIIKKYTTYIQGLDCLIDSLPELWGDEFMGYPIISPDEIENRKIDIVIIASKVQADSIIKGLLQRNPYCEYIDIYKELDQRGIKIYHKFFEESNVYTNLYQMRVEYENETDESAKEIRLKNIIKAYLSIQDFYYSEYFGREYIKEKYSGYENLIEFYQKLNSLIVDIKQKNNEKKDDVVVFFIDSLRAMDVFHRDANGNYKADMLEKYIDNGVVFTKAKSTGVTTYESMVSVIKKKYPYELNVYENNIMANFDEFELLPIVKNMDYDINFYVTEGYQIINNCPEINFVKQVYLSSKLWKLTTDMACNNKKTFNFIYVPYELHFPLICGYHAQEPQVSGFVDVGILDTKNFVPRQLEECKTYVDRQFSYYENWFSREILITMFSDHSQVVFDEQEQKPYFMYYNNPDRCVNVTFLIRGFGVRQQWNEDLVSLYDFTDIMKGLIQQKKLVVPERNIAIYQYYKIHYKKLREYAKEYGVADNIDGMQCFISKKYLYMVTPSGREEVYKIGSKEDIIKTEEGKMFIKEVYEHCNVKFPEFITDYYIEGKEKCKE